MILTNIKNEIIDWFNVTVQTNGLYKNKKQITDWLDKYQIENYELQPCKKYGYVVNVNGDVNLAGRSLLAIKVKFSYVAGNLYLNNNNLESLIGCPEKVRNSFQVYFNKLTSLQFGPSLVGGYYDCSNNQLTSLKGCPEIINNDFICDENKLTSLKFGPREIKNNFKCNHNNLTSIEDCPQKIGGDFMCNNNEIISLKGIPQTFNNVLCCDVNNIVSLEFCPLVLKYLHIACNDLQTLSFLPNEILNGCNFDHNPNYPMLKGIYNFKEVKSILLNEKLTNELDNRTVALPRMKI